MREELTVPDLYFKIIEKRPLPRKKEEKKWVRLNSALIVYMDVIIYI